MTALSTVFKPAHGRLSRFMAWLALLSMVQLLAHPLLAAAEDRAGEDYSEWLVERGARESAPELEDALDRASRARHSSLESLVVDFVSILDDAGELEGALSLFRTDGGPSLETADDLLALILSDLRSLSPKEPRATTRLSTSDIGATQHAPRVARAAAEKPERRSVPGGERVQNGQVLLASFGLKTSIQALGP